MEIYKRKEEEQKSRTQKNIYTKNTIKTHTKNTIKRIYTRITARSYKKKQKLGIIIQPPQTHNIVVPFD